MIGTRGVIGQGDNGEDNLSGVQPSDRKIMAELKLIVQPEKFDGKSIRLIGFLSIEFEGTADAAEREQTEKSSGSIVPTASPNVHVEASGAA